MSEEITTCSCRNLTDIRKDQKRPTTVPENEVRTARQFKGSKSRAPGPRGRNQPGTAARVFHLGTVGDTGSRGRDMEQCIDAGRAESSISDHSRLLKKCHHRLRGWEGLKRMKCTNKRRGP